MAELDPRAGSPSRLGPAARNRGADQLPRSQPSLHRACQLEVEIASAVVHVADAGHPPSQEQWQMPLPGGNRLDGPVQRHVGHRVDMHVPQTGDEIAACRIDYLCTGGHPDLVGCADGRDVVARYKNGLSSTERSIHDIDDGDISDGHARGLRPRAGSEQQTGDNQQDFHAFTS